MSPIAFDKSRVASARYPRVQSRHARSIAVRPTGQRTDGHVTLILPIDLLIEVLPSDCRIQRKGKVFIRRRAVLTGAAHKGDEDRNFLLSPSDDAHFFRSLIS